MTFLARLKRGSSIRLGEQEQRTFLGVAVCDARPRVPDRRRRPRPWP